MLHSKFRVFISSLSLIALVLVLAGCGKKADDEVERSDEIIPVMVSMVIEEFVTRPVNGSGIVYPIRSEKLSFRTGGTVAYILYKEGDRVSPGSTLASLDIQRLTRAWVETGLELINSRQRVIQLGEQFKQGSISENQFRDEEAKKELLADFYYYAKDALKYPLITAKFSGRIDKWFVAVGDSVPAGSPVVFVVEIDPQAMTKMGLTEDDYFHVGEGDSAVVNSTGELELPLKGVITRKGLADDGSDLPFYAEIVFENPGGILKMGDRVSISIAGDITEKVVLIPQDAVIERQGNSGSVFVTSAKNNFAVRRHVELGPEIGFDILIDKGLHRGDLIITHGQKNLKHGSRIAILSPEEKGFQ